MKIPEGTIFCWACREWVSQDDASKEQCFEMHEQSENYDRNAPWRDWPPYPQMPMEVMKTRDGEERIEWAYPSNCGNLEAGWVIYKYGAECAAYLDSDSNSYYNPNNNRKELG